MKALIVDDHEVVRCGVRRALEQLFPEFTIDEAATAEQAIEKILKVSWDLMILDLSMPGKGGLELLRELRGLSPKLPVLVQSFHAKGEFALRALRAGAQGYITKASCMEQLLNAVRKVLGGGRYVSPEVAEEVLSHLSRDSAETPMELLSNREYEVMLRIALGNNLNEIGKELHLSVKTVGTYRTRILEKMGFKRNVDITLFAVRNGMI